MLFFGLVICGDDKVDVEVEDEEDGGLNSDWKFWIDKLLIINFI